MKKLFLFLAGVACIGAAALMGDGKKDNSCDTVGGDSPDADDQPAEED